MCSPFTTHIVYVTLYLFPLFSLVLLLNPNNSASKFSTPNLRFVELLGGVAIFAALLCLSMMRLITCCEYDSMGCDVLGLWWGGDFNFFSSLGVFFCFLFCWSVLVGWLSEVSRLNSKKEREKERREKIT